MTGGRKEQGFEQGTANMPVDPAAPSPAGHPATFLPVSPRACPGSLAWKNRPRGVLGGGNGEGSGVGRVLGAGRGGRVVCLGGEGGGGPGAGLRVGGQRRAGITLVSSSPTACPSLPGMAGVKKWGHGTPEPNLSTSHCLGVRRNLCLGPGEHGHLCAQPRDGSGASRATNAEQTPTPAPLDGAGSPISPVGILKGYPEMQVTPFGLWGY